MSKKYTTDNITISEALNDGSGVGTSGQVLSSTGTGVSWINGSAIAGGPYLALTGGTLTGDLTISNSTHSYLNVNAANTGASEAGVLLQVGGVTKWEIYTAANDGNYSIWSAGQGIKFYITPTGAATFAGTINSGAITSTGTGTFAGGSSNNNDGANALSVTSSEHVRMIVDTSSTGGHRASYVLESNGNEVDIATAGSGKMLFSTGATLALTLDSSQNATFAGTIDSGAITSTGTGEFAGEVQARLPRSNTAGVVALSIQPSDTTAHYGWRIDTTNNSLNLDNVGSSLNIMTYSYAGNVGVGVADPAGKVHIMSASASSPASYTGSDDLILEGSGNSGMTIYSGTSSEGTIAFGDSGSNYQGAILYQHATSAMLFRTAGVNTRYTIDASGNNTWSGTGTFAGNVTIGNTTSVQPLTVAGNVLFRTTTANGFENRFQFIVGGAADAGNFYVYDAAEVPTIRLNGDGDSYFNGGSVGIGTDSPAAKLHTRLANSATEQIGLLMNTESNAAGAGLVLAFGFNNGTSTTPNGGAIAVLKNATGRTDFSFRNNLANGVATEKMRINGDGNVGIGVSAPVQKLEVLGTIQATGANAAYAAYMKGNYSGDDAMELGVGSDATGQHKLITSGNHYFGTELRFWTSDTRRLTIDSSGNVGVGVTAPITKLSNTAIRGAAASGLTTSLLGLNWEIPAGASSQGYVASFTNTQTAAANANAGVLIEVGSVDTTTRLLSVESGGVNRFEVRGDGSVGIGTDSPAALLDVRGATTATSGKIALQNSDGSVFTQIYSGHSGDEPWFGWTTGKDLRFAVSTNLAGSGFAEHMRITSSGNVGIGVTAPGAKLEVKNTGVDSGIIAKFVRSINAVDEYAYITVGNASPAYFGNLQKSDDVAYISRAADPSGGNGLFVQASGNVGIGDTNPSAKLSIAGRVYQTGLGFSTLFGYQAGNADDLGNNYNAFFGYQSGLLSTSAQYNTAVGSHALYSQTTALGSSTAVGYRAMYNVTTGNNNTAVGFQALHNVTTTSDNVAVGYKAGRYTGGTTNVTGAARSVFIGGDTEASGVAVGNEIVIGYGAVGQGANTVMLGDSNNVDGVYAYGEFNNISDESVKENVVTITGALDKVKAMRGVGYNLIGHDTAKVGVIAQEMEAILPEVVAQGASGLKSVAYGNIVAVLIEAMKEQQVRIEALEAQLFNQ